MCTTRGRIPAGASTNQGPEKGDLTVNAGGGRGGAVWECGAGAAEDRTPPSEFFYELLMVILVWSLRAHAPAQAVLGGLLPKSMCPGRAPALSPTP